MNRVYGVEEGRPFWRLKPQQLLLTVVLVVLCAACLVIVVVTGPVARSVGDVLGVGDDLVVLWDFLKWPVLALVVTVVVALLYWATPNVRDPGFRLVTVGALVAMLVWALASVGFAFYVANFSAYNRTYGSLAGVVVLLLWLFLTNVALVLGAELDAELERGRQLRRGIPAEEALQVRLRDDREIREQQRRRARDLAAHREIRLAAAAATAAPLATTPATPATPAPRRGRRGPT